MSQTNGTAADIIIVGSGIAGLTAALAATLAGLKPLVLEKTELIGGVSCWSYGTIWVGASDLAKAAGFDDSALKVVEYLNFLGGGENDLARSKAFGALAPDALIRLREAGITFQLIAGMNDLLAGRAPGAAHDGRTLALGVIDGRSIGPNRARLRIPPGPQEWRLAKSVVVREPDRAKLAAMITEAQSVDQLAQGIGIVGHLLRALADFDVPILTECHVEKLIMIDGAIRGVVTQDNQRFNGDAVMLATGNYLADRALVASLDQISDYRPWCPPASTGDGLRMAADAGGLIRATRNNRGIFLGFDDPSDPEGALAGIPSTRELSRAHGMVVNRAGKRFSNEGFFQDTAVALRILDVATREPANLPCWFIFDQTYADQWGLADALPGAVPGWVKTASDIASLAVAAGIDPAGLAGTVERFNGFAETGFDEDFGRAPGWKMAPSTGTGINPALGAVAKAPFYAARLWPTLGIGGSGVKTDAAARVMGWHGVPIPGLYAAGDAALHDEFGTGYQAGITISAAIVFAFAAIDDLART